MWKLFFLEVAACLCFYIICQLVPPRPLSELKVPEDHFEVLFSPTDSQLVSYPWIYEPDKLIRIWDFETGSQVGAVTVPQKEVSDTISVKYAPDGKSFVAGSWKASSLFSSSGKLLRRFERCSTHFSPNAGSLFVEKTPDQNGEAAFSPQSDLSLWNIRRGRTEWSITSDMPLAFDKDGLHFVTLEKNRLIFWELLPSAPPRRLHDHLVKTALGFDANLLSFVGSDQPRSDGDPQRLSLREMETGRVRTTYSLPKLNKRFHGSVNRDAYLCDDDHVLIVEQSTFTPILVLPGMVRVTACDTFNTFELLNNESAKIVLSENKKWLAIRSFSRFLVWDMTNMREHFSRPIEGTSWPAKLGFAGNGHYFFTGDELEPGNRASWDSLDKFSFGLLSRYWPIESRIQVWDVERKSPVLSIPAVDDAVFSPDGRRIATKHEGGVVRVWDIAHHTNWAVVWKLAIGMWIGVVGIGFLLRKMFRRLTRKPQLVFETKP